MVQNLLYALLYAVAGPERLKQFRKSLEKKEYCNFGGQNSSKFQSIHCPVKSESTVRDLKNHQICELFNFGDSRRENSAK